MKPRYGYLLLTICWMGLAGCANWKTGAQSTMGRPTAANNLTIAGHDAGGPVGVAPGNTFGEPPPPVPPAYNGPGGSGERLNLASADVESPRPDRMYNLEKSGSSASSSKSSSGSSSKSSAISKLASKADSSVKKSDPGTVASAAPKSVKSESALTRLSAEATRSSEKETVKKETVVEEKPLPVPSAVKPEVASENTQIIDTTLLAQPVRKGADSSVTEGPTGPQSNAMPKANLFHLNKKPAIYPVSNPVAEEEPVDITQFS